MAGVMNPELHKQQVNEVWKATGILAVVTIVEVTAAILHDIYLHGAGLKMVMNIFMIVASLLKAFYIVAVFMHLKYEKTAMRLTILMPMLFFVWFIIAFLWEGQSWFFMRVFF